jgi:PAS domain S-box-containing protein
MDRIKAEARWQWLIPMLVLIVVLALELATPTIRVTPSLLTIALVAFSLFLGPKKLAVWSLVLFVPVVLTLNYLSNSGVPEPKTFVMLRTAAYVAVAILAVGLSRYRERAEKHLAGLLALIDALQTPIVVSDINGRISYANRACCELVGRSLEELQALDFFAVFSTAGERGKRIEKYLAYFEEGKSPDQPLEINLGEKDDRKTYSANCTILLADKKKLLVSQIS